MWRSSETDLNMIFHRCFCPKDLYRLCVFHWGMRISSPFVCHISQLNSPAKPLCYLAWKDKGTLRQEILIQIVRCTLLASFSTMSDSFFFLLMSSLDLPSDGKSQCKEGNVVIRTCSNCSPCVLNLILPPAFWPCVNRVTVGFAFWQIFSIFSLCEWIVVATNALR